MAPEGNEMDWKETVKVYPGQMDMAGNALTVGCTTIIAKFTAPPKWAGTKGEYMWHCHILEHEEHDMMRRMTLAP
jgi:spore coat protein A